MLSSSVNSPWEFATPGTTARSNCTAAAVDQILFRILSSAYQPGRRRWIECSHRGADRSRNESFQFAEPILRMSYSRRRRRPWQYRKAGTTWCQSTISSYLRCGVLWKAFRKHIPTLLRCGCKRYAKLFSIPKHGMPIEAGLNPSLSSLNNLEST